MKTRNEKLLDFIWESPTAYHVCEAMAKRLLAAGAKELMEGTVYPLAPGGTYYVRRNGSSLIAFRIPKGRVTGFHILASHSDSPCFKLKETAEVLREGRYTSLNVEKYGGMLMAPWMDRPLSIAGRVAVREGRGVRTRLIDLARPVALIPNLAIHMNREANEGYRYNAQKDMLPLFGEAAAKGRLLSLVAEAAGASAEDVLGSDLFLYNCQRGTVWGADEEFLSAPRLDDLACVFGSLEGFLEQAEAEGDEACLPVCAVFDNEETGSLSKQGASSTFLQDTLSRIEEALGGTREDYLRLLSSSMMISADNAHAVHPNHTDKSDEGNRPYLNGGIVVKYHASQKYTTDGVSAALLRLFCEKAGVTLQVFANRSDMAGGSTLGNLSNAQVSLNTVDIGLPQLAMHSPYETAGARDVEEMVKLARTFFSSGLRAEANGYELL